MRGLFPFMKQDKFPALSLGLRKVLGTSELKAIQQNSPDRRLLLQVAAERAGRTERELLGEVAEKLSLRIAPRVIPTEAHNLPVGIDLRTLRRSGCIAIMKEGVFRGVICSDPLSIPETFKLTEGMEFLLAPWSEIVEALGASEEALEKHREENRKAQREKEREIVERVFLLLVKQVEEHGQQEVKISFEGKQPQYVFVTNEGRSGRGYITEELTQPFLKLLEEEQFSKDDFSCQFRAIEKKRYYQISWNPVAEEEAKQENSHQGEKGLVLFEGTKPENSDSVVERTYTSSVLLIDDNDTFGGVVERFFVREGVSIQRKCSAKEALRELENGKIRPRVIVCDLHMPEMNGLQFVKELRSQSRFSEISLFMLTSDEEVETELDAVRSGVQAYLRKNEDPRLLCAHVERVLRQSSSSKAA